MRNYLPELLELLDNGTVRFAGMIKIELGEGAFGFIRRAAPFVFDGVTYNPIPDGIINVSGFSRATGMTAESFSVTLSEAPDNGITPEVILRIEEYDYRDRPITIYDLHVHPDTGAVLGSPIPMARGYINSIIHRQDEQSGHIATFACENRKLDYSRSNGRIRSTQDQSRRAPGDLGFNNASLAGRIDLKWGKK